MFVMAVLNVIQVLAVLMHKTELLILVILQLHGKVFLLTEIISGDSEWLY